MLLGGLLTRVFGWEAVFLVNVALAASALLLVFVVIPRDGEREKGRMFDLPGALSVTLGVTLIVFALVQGPGWGWLSPGIRRGLVGGATAPGKLLESPYLGRSIAPGQEIDRLREDGFRVTDFEPSAAADLLAAGHIGAVAEGRSEVGPRGLCHRSIVAMPHSASVRDTINRLKGRETWHPLAPVTLPGYARRLWSGQGLRELYMAGNVVVSGHGQRVLPAAVHVDGTTRPQVLPPGQAPVVESLLTEFTAREIPPVLVNASFNGRGEPLVDTAGDAARAFRTLGLDFLVLGEHLVHGPT